MDLSATIGTSKLQKKTKNHQQMAFVEFCEYGIDFWVFGQKNKQMLQCGAPQL